METAVASLRAEYQQALVAYLGEPNELALYRADSLGKQALAGNLGVIDVVVIHHACLAAVVGTLPSELDGPEGNQFIRRSSDFLCEMLTAFEITHRGFREVTQVLNETIAFGQVVCHELRTPLTSLVNSVGALKEVAKYQPDDVRARLVRNIELSTDILRSRTDDLMDFVSLEAGTLVVKKVRMDPVQHVRKAIDQLAAEARAAQVVIELSVEEPLPDIHADPVRFGQIVTNLVQNAVKYGADGGRIDVRAKRSESGIVLEVQDYGGGISLAERMSIFQPNYRAKKTANEVPGFGIGLALCKSLVNDHHGTLTLESTEGKGSTFRVTLPVE